MSIQSFWLLGKYGPNEYHHRSPLLLLWRIRHRLTGPQRGCSCTRCFRHPKRRVLNQEIIHLNVRMAQLERDIRKLRSYRAA